MPQVRDGRVVFVSDPIVEGLAETWTSVFFCLSHYLFRPQVAELAI